MYSQILRPSMIAFVAIAGLIACAKPEPHLGASITTVEGDGVTITEADSRRLLPDGKLAGDEAAMLALSAKVLKINHEKRMIALATPKGETLELIVGEEVRNLPQVKVGDSVNVQYLVSMAFEVRKPTEEEKAIAGQPIDASARARLGELPAAGAATGKVKIGTIDTIDKKAGTVTISGLTPEGPTVIQAKYPENLNYANAGDTVVVTMVQAFATNVTRVE